MLHFSRTFMVQVSIISFLILQMFLLSSCIPDLDGASYAFPDRKFPCFTCDNVTTDVESISYLNGISTLGATVTVNIGDEVEYIPSLIPNNIDRGVYSYTLSKNNLPVGLFLNPATGVISGTVLASPSSTGASTIEVTGTKNAIGSTTVDITFSVSNTTFDSQQFSTVNVDQNYQMISMVDAMDKYVEGNSSRKGYQIGEFSFEDITISFTDDTNAKITSFTDAVSISTSSLPHPQGVLLSSSIIRTTGMISITGAVPTANNHVFNIAITDGTKTIEIPIHITVYLESNPRDGIINVPVNHFVSFTFSDPSTDSSTYSNLQIFPVDAGVTDMSSPISHWAIYENHILTLRPKADLEQNKTYKVYRDSYKLLSFTTASGQDELNYKRGIPVRVDRTETYTVPIVHILEDALTSVIAGDDSVDGDLLQSAVGKLRFKYEVNISRLVYTSVSFEGELVERSALIAYPNPTDEYPIDEDEEFAFLVYEHGTIFRNQEAPSESVLKCTVFDLSGEKCEILDDDFPLMTRLNPFLGAALASDGAILVSVDHSGYGVDYPEDGYDYNALDKPIHLYLHSYVAADETMDVMRATRQVIPSSYVNQVRSKAFLTGYSEGGLTGMAAVKVAQQRFFGIEGVQIDYFGLGAGPYNLHRSLYDYYFPSVATQNKEPAISLSYEPDSAVVTDQPLELFIYLYIGIGLEAYNRVFHTGLRLEDVFILETSSSIIDAKEHNLYLEEDHVGRSLGFPIDVNNAFLEVYTPSITEGELRILNTILQSQSLHDWFLDTPGFLFHAAYDHQVSPFTTQEAVENYRMQNPEFFASKVKVDTDSCQVEFSPTIRDNNLDEVVEGELVDPHSNCFINYLSILIDDLFLTKE